MTPARGTRVSLSRLIIGWPGRRVTGKGAATRKGRTEARARGLAALPFIEIPHV